MSYLPPEIITNILIRLPAKSLLRFRCVSKPWSAEIDGPDFVKLHLTHSISTASKYSPIAGSNGTLYSLDSEKLEKINTPFQFSSKGFLFNTCNGLLLLQANDINNWKSQKLIIFNPFTRNHLVLPTSPFDIRFADLDGLNWCSSLGYDAINDDYKVFNILLMQDAVTKKFHIGEVRVYSLKSNSWHIFEEPMKGFRYSGSTIKRFLEAYVNGALHTINLGNPISIAALDVGKESFRLLPLPNLIEGDVALSAQVFDGCLAVKCRYSDYRTDIWVMKEYGVKESWTMLMSLKPNDVCLPVIPLVYSKSCTEILLIYDTVKLVWYDLGKKTFRNFPFNDLPVEFGPVVCIESLVSVGGHVKIDEKKQQGEEEVKKEIVKKRRDDFLSNGFILKLKGLVEASCVCHGLTACFR